MQKPEDQQERTPSLQKRIRHQQKESGCACFEYHPPLPWLLNRTEVPGLPGPGPAVLTIEPGDPGRAGCVFQLTRAGPASRKSRKKPGRVRAGSGQGPALFLPLDETGQVEGQLQDDRKMKKV